MIDPRIALPFSSTPAVVMPTVKSDRLIATRARLIQPVETQASDEDADDTLAELHHAHA